MKPRAPIVKRNLQRWKRKFVRNFHSRRRVLWIKGLPCAFCGRNRTRNAHMNARGMGGCGGDYTRILPLCIDCDERFYLGRTSFLEVLGLTWADVETKLAQVNAAWEQML